jgi:Tfp pilus assembly protein PilX
MRAEKDQPNSTSRESGAALVTVLLVAVLLVTASAAMLSAVGASSRNNSDALAESKAYWAAESGLQATINVLRHGGVSYSDAVADPTLAGYLPYDLGTNRVPVGDETSYQIAVVDPDDSGSSTTYSVTATFLQADGTYGPSRTFGSGGDTTTISFVDQPSTTVNHPTTDGTGFGSFRIQRTGNGADASITNLRFRVDYIMSLPRPAVRSFRGQISASREVTFDFYQYDLVGSVIDLCGTSNCSPAGSFALTLPTSTVTPQDRAIYGRMSPLEPYRLLVTATGFGPNGSRKTLESIMQRNFFNDVNSASAIAMIGTGPGIFNPGASQQMSIDGGTVPSVGVTDPAVLQTVVNPNRRPPMNGTMEPPPEVLGNEIPSWQQSTYEMDALVRQLRQAAQNSGRYFTSGQTIPSWGDHDAGTGITSTALGGTSAITNFMLGIAEK